jgi:glutamate carboxypeptidase
MAIQIGFFMQAIVAIHREGLEMLSLLCITPCPGDHKDWPAVVRSVKLCAIVGALAFSGTANGKDVPDQRLWAAAQAEKASATETLRALVTIETPTSEPGGMAQLGELLADRLSELGASVEHIPAASASKGNIIVGRLKGKGKARILLMAHMDTIYPMGTLAKRPFRIEGNRAYGPGIADDKGGIAIILHTLKVLKSHKFSKYGEIVVMFNTDEESGSVASAATIVALAGSSDVVLSFEPTSAGTEFLTLATSGGGVTTVTVQGQAAHAGAEPERGRNALVEAAAIVMKTRDLDDPAAGVRFNWTIMSSGSIRNQIPDGATLSADTRHLSAQERDKKLALLAERIKTPTIAGTSATMSYREGRPSYFADAASKVWIDRAIKFYAEIGSKLETIPSTGGGTDAGFAQKSGKPIVEGLGLPGFGFHSSEEEYVDIDRIPARVYLASRLIMEASR